MSRPETRYWALDCPSVSVVYRTSGVHEPVSPFPTRWPCPWCEGRPGHEIREVTRAAFDAVVAEEAGS